MNALTSDRFVEFYQAIHGYEPFPWQNRLAARVCDHGRGWPMAIALPTAAGKTACIDIALFALACQANVELRTAPRRIFFVVDRRVVVDQAWLHADFLRRRLLDPQTPIESEVASALCMLSGGDRPLDVYALRGGMYREDVWVRTPLQPTVIASTVDQVGSRLLFRGYGVSDSMKPIHAGLVGNDALILLDEAHCAKPFAETADAVARYRVWNEALAPFKFVTMTATPSVDIPAEQIERDEQEDRDHEILGPRIKASKPATLVVADKAKGKKGRIELVKVLAREAQALMGQDLGKDKEGKDHPVGAVGVIVNRVATARDLATELRKGEAKVILLTGRMRPLDRDIVLEDLGPLFSGKSAGMGPTFVVATQCLEVGADLDFHALVTECASLDALRQRFGRLNRIAARPSAKAVVVIRGDETEDTTDDPVYGESLAKTWQWLQSKAAEGVFDFGVGAVRNAIGEEDPSALNAPTASAPVLLPAHLDCWVQTAPTPEPDPDPAIFLHGPKQSGVPDVQVVFRGDLGDDPRKWAEVVALCPPSSSESLPVRIDVFGRWLAGEVTEDESADIEGGPPMDNAPDETPESSRRVLSWKGLNNDETEVISSRKDLRPNRTYVVSLAESGILSLGDFPTRLSKDHAEAAFQRSRDRAILRLPGIDLKREDEEFEDKLNAALDSLVSPESPDWFRIAVKDLSAPKRRTIAAYPAPLLGFVVTGKHRLHRFDPTFDDDESSESPTRVRVTLEDHTRGVVAYADRFIRGCGLDRLAPNFVLAARWHDLGKADPRFQAMLQGRSPHTARPPLLAKSGMPYQSRWEREAARVIHRYPKGARHEMLSVAAVADRTDDNLILHLIASHHGAGRPFASKMSPATDAPAGVPVRLFNEEFVIVPTDLDPLKVNATVPQRFWKFVRHFGWWGAAYLEAIFRLADQAASQAEQEGNPCPIPEIVAPSVPVAALPKMRFPLTLPGLDGSNPLAFLAAVGTILVADQLYPGSRMRWERTGKWQPVLELPEEMSKGEFVVRAAGQLAKMTGHPAFTLGELKADNLIASLLDYRRLCQQACIEQFPERTLADYCAAFGSDVIHTEMNPELIQDTAFRTMSGAGHQHFLAFFRNIVKETQTKHLEKALLAEWRYDDPLTNLTTRWDPQDDVRYALRWKNPSSENTQRSRFGSVLGANRLAIEGLRLFPSVPSRGRLVTTGFRGSKRSDTFFSWPIWVFPFTVDAVRSILGTADLQVDEPDPIKLQGVGIGEVFRSQRITQGKYRNFSPACAV